MSSVKPKPRSAGHFYATGSHLIDAANHLFLAVNQQVDKVESETVNTSSHLDIVDEELRASDLDLRGEEDTGEGNEEEAAVEEDRFEGEICESPPPSYHSPPLELQLSALDLGHTSVQLLDEVISEGTDPEEEETMPAEANAQNFLWLLGLGLFVAVIAVSVNAVISSHHNIQEGSVGIYFKFGALGEGISYPGVHWQAPFISHVEEVRIRPQTDSLKAMEAITKDGITNTFNDVQVISRIRVDNLIPMVRKFGLDFRGSLIFDRVKEELRKFCANHTIDEVYNTKFLDIVGTVKKNVVSSIERLGDGGLEILNLVIAKPNIPPDIAHNYKQVKVQWTEQLVATQRQKTQQIVKETEKLNALADADRQKAVLEVDIQKQLINKEGQQNISLLEAEHQQRLELVKKETEKQKAIADAERDKTVMEITNERRIVEKEGDQKVSELHQQQLMLEGETAASIKQLAIKKEAEANKLLFTPEYVKLAMAKSISPNMKYYFSGENSIVNGLIGKIMD